MKTKYIFLLKCLCLLLFFCGCSVKKNTAFRRNYHALTTKYNVYFNAKESFKKGYKKTEESYQPNYSQIIDMYAISSNTTTGVAKGDMARAIEKCEKAIKEHSIRKKPKKNVNKTRDPKYMAFYNQEEFNPKMDDVWMLMGKAKFYSNDYLAASATFTYIIKHFSEDKRLVAEASIWKAKCFKEMDWTYEAEDLLKKISDEQFDNKINNLYSGAYADLLIQQNELEAALPYLETAISLEKNKKQRTRFYFIAGQIYQQLGQKGKAYDMFDKVLSANPVYEMAFNAQIRQTEVYTGETSKDLIKSLHKMAKSSKNKDYLDQIYYAIGNIYLAQKDTTQAIENYTISVEKSTRNGLDKAQSLIVLGNLYYEQAKYLKAQPCYSEASSLIDHEHPDYQKVSSLSLILDELVQNHQTVILQDSLQYLASLSKEERLQKINLVIQKIIEEEKEEQKRREQEKLQNKQLDMEIENMAIMDQRALGNTQKANWYFFNKNTVEKGKMEFQRKYGKRRLEDNWNRKNKTITAFSDEALAEFQNESDNENNAATDSINGNEKVSDAENNPKRPEYYLRQIPFTEEQKAFSNEQIANSLFNMGIIYNEKLSDYPKSIETFEEFTKRFPNDLRVADGYFYCYRICGKLENNDKATDYRNRIITEYPNSKYAQILSHPDYQLKLEKMQMEQDSLYEITYREFLAGNFETVKSNTVYMEKTYPVSPLMPKFLLLNALSLGKSGERDSFHFALNNLLTRYPNSDVASMAKDILALMNQGESPTSGTPGGLMALREEKAKEKAEESGISNAGFKINNNITHLFKIITDPNEVEENRLLYETATYNFTKFLVKDFDLNIKNGTLTVSGLDNLEEALWYINGIFEDKGIQKLLYGKKYKYIIISEENNELLNKGFTIEQYEQFYKDSIAEQKANNVNPKIELIGDEKEIEEMATDQLPLSEIKEGENIMNAIIPGKPQNIQEENASQKNKESILSEGNKQEEKLLESQITQQSVIPEKPKATETTKPKKELKKYKGLYTYDEEAPHYFAILVPKGGVDFNAIKAAIDKYNNTSQALLNLSVTSESGKNFPQIITVGILPGVKVSQSYIRQIVKDAEIKSALKGVEYRNIVISKDNLDVLKESGNITVYMELFKRLYLGR